MSLSKIPKLVHAKPFRTWAYIETMNADFLNCSESTKQSPHSREAPRSFRTCSQVMNLIEDETDDEDDSKVAIFPLSNPRGEGWSSSFTNPKKLSLVGVKLAAQVLNGFG